jgi:hypothetical protein
VDLGRIEHGPSHSLPRRAAQSHAFAERRPRHTCVRKIGETESMRRLKLLIVLPLVLVLAACTGRPSLESPPMGGPDLALEEYFDGQLVAHGQFQDRFGEVRRRFKVDIDGTWDGETLTLVEDFTYEDGATERRVWTLRKTGPDSWAGTAPGVVGEARGTVRGDTFNWTYTIDLPETSGGFRADFDDWMWQLDEARLLNRAYVSRFGVDLGEVIIFFERLE